MFLKNYTSEVPVSQTVYRIEQVLLKAGVTDIAKQYGANQKILAITFAIQFDENTKTTVRLPVNEEQAIQALWMDYADEDKLTPDGKSLIWSPRKKKSRADFIQQGERTAWKIIQDWVEVQMSMIQMNQADFRQVFLPYIWDGKQSVYERMVTGGFKQLQLTQGE